ncbi:MAG TPA: hypothetical protein PKZ36_02860 [Candidatus Paceibacterota bacterium]|nr:hypothetical protein [Candidatus Paceibacterota bacterium]HPT18320.1 hypothetical protein [Candidatus Paceibacterota bacterium]
MKGKILKVKCFVSNIIRRIKLQIKAHKALKFFLMGASFVVFVFLGVFVAMLFGLTNVEGSIDSKSNLYNSVQDVFARKDQIAKTPPWARTDDWTVVRRGLVKDRSTIAKVSKISGVPARTILAPIVVEQFRYFGSNRELLKKIFLPLQTLGNSVKFSYGIAGIKIATAKQIEANLKDNTSPYYLGGKYRHLLDFKTDDPDEERMARLTNKEDHYYSYLYTALFIKQIEMQWKNAGYPISDRPEILATIFNLGFVHSSPKDNPSVGGSNITVDKKTYTFGGLAYEFFYSDELAKTFPIF